MSNASKTVSTVIVDSIFGRRNFMHFFYFQMYPGTSIDGHVMDYFDAKGPGFQYVNLRNDAGAGVYNSKDMANVKTREINLISD